MDITRTASAESSICPSLSRPPASSKSRTKRTKSRIKCAPERSNRSASVNIFSILARRCAPSKFAAATDRYSDASTANLSRSDNRDRLARSIHSSNNSLARSSTGRSDKSMRSIDSWTQSASSRCRTPLCLCICPLSSVPSFSGAHRSASSELSDKPQIGERKTAARATSSVLLSRKRSN